MNVSSEMFVSLMRVLYDTLPCTQNFLRLKAKYQENSSNKVKAIASPNIIRGLGLADKSP